MPQQKQPIRRKPKVEDESIGQGGEKHGKHREQDEALPGSGGGKGGLNRESGVGRDDERAPTKGGPQSNR